MKNLGIIISIITLIIAITSCNMHGINSQQPESDITGTQTKAVIWDDPNAKYFVGFGEDINTSQIKPPDGVIADFQYETDNIEQYKTSVTVTYIDSYEKLRDYLKVNVKLSGSGDVGGVLHLGGSVDYTYENEITITNQTIVLCAQINLFKGRYKTSNETLSDEAIALLNTDVNVFVNRYGSVYRQAAVIAGRINYFYTYTFNDQYFKTKEDFILKTRAYIMKRFDINTEVTINSEEEEWIKHTLTDYDAFTNITNYVINPISNVDHFKAELARLSDFSSNPANIINFSPVEKEYISYSEMINTPQEYKIILNKIVDFKIWQEKWLKLKNNLMDIRDLTSDSNLKNMCITAIQEVETELIKINDYSSDARGPRDDEYAELVELYTIKQRVMDGHFYMGYPIYYNTCDSASDIKNPVIGRDYGTYLDETKKKGGRHYTRGYVSYKFYNGYKVGSNNRSKKDYCQSTLYPFYNNKPYIMTGTCSFWANVRGGWRGKGDDTYINGYLYFYLTDQTYLQLYGPAKADYYNVNLYVKGSCVYTFRVANELQKSQFILKWDFENTNLLQLYINGKLSKSVSTSETPATLYGQPIRFLLKAHCSNGGDYRPSTAAAYIDNIVIYNTLEDVNIIYSHN